MKHSLTARNLQPEKLTFGIHKSQDLFLMKRRLDLQEIVPWWYTLAQFVPKLDELPDEKLAAYKLLQEFEIATREQKNDLVGKILQDIFLACFSHDLVPSLCDKSFQGILAPEIIANTSSSPLVFLRQLFDQIKSLFIQFSDDSISILPALPPEFPVGKLIDVNIAGLKVNLEWTKKRIRRVELFNLSSVTKELSLNFRHIKFCRLQTGSFKSACKFYNADNLILPANSYFLFDNFLF